MASTPNPVLGARARAARERLGLRQAEVAERLGISVEVYGRFERGVVNPRLSTLLRLCSILHTDPNGLLVDEPDADRREPAGPPPQPELRALIAVLEGADDTTLRRVTEVARWLRPAGPAAVAVVAVTGGRYTVRGLRKAAPVSRANEPRQKLRRPARP